MRVRLSLATGLIASLALLGACQQEPAAEAWQDETPPPSVETIEVAPLAGGPSETSQVAARQAADDAWVARLEAKGLIAKRQMDPDTGAMVWVISNKPIANPVLRGGPVRHAGLTPSRRSRGTIASGVYADNSRAARPAVAASAAASTAADASASSEAAASADAAVAAADATAAEATVAEATTTGVQPIPEADQPVNIVDPARAGFEMTPMMWGIAGLIVLALLAALFMANRPKSRRPNYHATQAPPEASGGNHEPHHA